MGNIFVAIVVIAIVLVVLDMWYQLRDPAPGCEDVKPEKRCPPHDWHWEELGGGRQRIVCTWCGPLKQRDSDE